MDNNNNNNNDPEHHNAAFLYSQVPQFHVYQDGVEAMDFQAVVPSHNEVSTTTADYSIQHYLSYGTTPSCLSTTSSSRSSSSVSSSNPSPATAYDMPAIYASVPINLSELADSSTGFKWNDDYSSPSHAMADIHLSSKTPAANQSAWFYPNEDFLLSPDVMESPGVSRSMEFSATGLEMSGANASFLQQQVALHQQHQAHNAPLSQPSLKREPELGLTMGLEPNSKATPSQQHLQQQQQQQQQQQHQRAVRFVNTTVPSTGILPSSKQIQSSKAWASPSSKSSSSHIGNGGSSSGRYSSSKSSSHSSSSHKSSSSHHQHSTPQGSQSQRASPSQSQSKRSSHSHSSNSNSNSHSNNNGGGSSSSSSNSHHGRKQYVCRHKHCDGPVFTRMADLQRHERHIHSDEQDKDHFYCDYPRCSRRDAPFHRKDHFREHLREYHIEDILKRGSNSNGHRAPFSPQMNSSFASAVSPGSSAGGLSPASAAAMAAAKKSKKPFSQEEWLRECYIDATWWRCARCLGRVVVAQQGWVCPECSGEIEPARRAIREAALKRLRIEA